VTKLLLFRFSCCSGTTNAYKISEEKLDGEKPPRMTRRRWEDNIKMHLRRTVWEFRLDLTSSQSDVITGRYEHFNKFWDTISWPVNGLRNFQGLCCMIFIHFTKLTTCVNLIIIRPSKKLCFYQKSKFYEVKRILYVHSKAAWRVWGYNEIKLFCHWLHDAFLFTSVNPFWYSWLCHYHSP
jgi:hypothetical protein